MLEVEIYNKLVELFGIDEVCIKKYNNRPQLTWVNFISGVLKLDSAELPKFCGLSSSSAFSRYFNKNFKSIMEAKQGGHWRIYLLSLINYIHCSTCGNIKSLDNFTKSNRSINGLRSVCKSCTSEYYLGNKKSI